jgi:hypothetical protein
MNWGLRHQREIHWRGLRRLKLTGPAHQKRSFNVLIGADCRAGHAIFKMGRISVEIGRMDFFGGTTAYESVTTKEF